MKITGGAFDFPAMIFCFSVWDGAYRIFEALMRYGTHIVAKALLVKTGMDELLSDGYGWTLIRHITDSISYYIILYPHEKYWNIAPFLVDFPQPCYRNGKPTGLRTFSLPLRWHKEPWDKRDVDDFVKPEMEKSHLQSCSYEYWAHIYIYIYHINIMYAHFELYTIDGWIEMGIEIDIDYDR